MVRRLIGVIDTAEGTSAISAPADFLARGLEYCAGANDEYDLVEAHMWLSIAAMRGSDDAKRLRVEIATEMTRREITSAQRKARLWLLAN